MKRIYAFVVMVLLSGVLLAACQPGEPEIAAIIVTIEPELAETGCIGQDQIIGGKVAVTVTTEDGNLKGIDRVEFFIDDMLLYTVTEPPFSFTADTSLYEDHTSYKFKVDVYDTSGTLHHSENKSLLVDNSIYPALKPLARAAGIEMGTCVIANQNYRIKWNDADYFASLCQNFSLIVADYGIYMDNLQNSRYGWKWSHPDSVIQFAEENGMRIRVHPLIWGIKLRWTDPLKEWAPTPRWVHRGNFSREELIDIMYDHIDAVMTRYKGRVQEYVVVNEPVDGTQPGEMARNVWTEGIGEDYVELAFRYARQVDPDAVLIINDFAADYPGQPPLNEPYKVDNYYNFVAGLLEKGTPIDAVGLQFALYVDLDNPTKEDIISNFDRYGDLGLEVYVTELNVRTEELPAPENFPNEQAKLYATVLQACLESKACTSFTVWEHADIYSYLISETEQIGLFDEDIQPKPAFFSVLEVLETFTR